MTVREHEIQARQFEYDEKRRKLRDLNDLRVHLASSVDRIASGFAGGNASVEDRRVTLQKSLDDIDRQIQETETAMLAARAFLKESENVRDGYDRVPVAVGKGRGRGQVEHIRIVRAQRG
ncbi:MAG: hypothetical protein OEZ03_00890 [Alphaproteobacteria bacterium]|nr:hypothetical protein [Alphaproteobacteria bacterium]